MQGKKTVFPVPFSHKATKATKKYVKHVMLCALCALVGKYPFAATFWQLHSYCIYLHRTMKQMKGTRIVPFFFYHDSGNTDTNYRKTN